MKQIEFNPTSLTLNEIDKITKKVRAFIINEDTNQVLLVHYAGLYMLPGGSIEEEENELTALKREILEEAGIEITEERIEPYLIIKSYDRNYNDRKQGQINRLTQTTFFKVSTTKEVKTDKKQLSVSEIEHGHSIAYTDLTLIYNLIKANKSNNPKRTQFDREILTALNEFLNLLDSEKQENIATEELHQRLINSLNVRLYHQKVLKKRTI